MPRRRLLTCCLMVTGAGLCLWLMLVVSGGRGGSDNNIHPLPTAPNSPSSEELQAIRHPPSKTSAHQPPSSLVTSSAADIGHSPPIYGGYTGPLSFVDDPSTDRMHVVPGLGDGGVAAAVQPHQQAEGIAHHISSQRQHVMQFCTVFYL